MLNWLNGVEAQMRKELLGGMRAETIVSDEEAHMVRDIVRRQEAMEDPYAWHRALEEFLRLRTTQG